ncbi:haloacid dehalogenase [Amylocystis lapponica]|nr:haloacid dehalogenase [Amylocystis lapponica]
MLDNAKHVLAFDIYGTLLDTSSIHAAIQTHTGLPVETAKELSLLWRRYQLEYTWRLNSMGDLQHAAAESDLALSEETVSGLMDAYERLSPFDDAVPALEALRGLPHVKMVSIALDASLPKTLLPFPLYLVGAVQRYKPAPEVYHGLLKSVGGLSYKASVNSAPDVWLVSGNPFDITGARAAGLGAIWVDRAGKGWTDQLPLDHAELGPLKVVHNLEEIAAMFSNLQ